MPTFSFLYSIPYILLFLLLYVNVLPIYKTNGAITFNNRCNIWLQQFSIVMILIVFIGFRGFVYTDWFSYYPYFNSAPSLFDGIYSINRFLEKPWESGFLLYTIVLKTIFPNYFFFQFISFIINLLVLFCFFKRVIPNQIVFGFLFYIIFSGLVLEFNLLRTSKSIMIFLISLKYLEEKKIIKYTALNIFGSLFHISSILYIPLYFFLNKKYPKIFVLSFFIIGNIIFVFQVEWFRLILTYIFNIIPGRLGKLTHIYLSSEAYGISIGYLERFFTFIFIYCLSNKLCKVNKNNLIYINAYYLYGLLFLYFSEMDIIFERVAILFVFSYWVLYPQIFSFLDKRSKQVFLILVLIFGVLKMGIGNRDILALYDNVLLRHRSYQERAIIFNYHARYIWSQ